MTTYSLAKIPRTLEDYKVGDIFMRDGKKYRVTKIVDGIPYLEQDEVVQFT